MSIRPQGVRAPGEALRGLLGLPSGPPPEVGGVTLDSRDVRPGDLYAALPGFHTHGARFVEQALAAGAAAVLTDRAGAELVQAVLGPDVAAAPLLVVDDPRGVLGAVSDFVYGHPSRALRTTGITGTNGKTSTSFLLDAALRAHRLTTGMVGTVATRIGSDEVPSARTTPEAPALHALLAVMVQQGVDAATLEVSSHALVLGRIDGIVFDLAVFTNLSQDHLDFHEDMDSYFAAKASLFTQARARAALVCVDDPWGARIAGLARDAGLPTATYGLTGPADWTAYDLVAGGAGAQSFTVAGPDGVELEGGVALPGAFNVANALAAIASAVHQGVPAQVAATAVRDCPGVPGRMEPVRAGQEFLALVDYAHTPDAVQRAIAAARQVARGRVLVVLGCGGDRDREKRPVMGEVAARAADVLIVTDDNPRSEEPSAIREAIMGGARRVETPARAEVLEQGDRRVAIADAVAMAGRGDVVLVLGKGHEQGQEAAGVISPFDDRVELGRALGGLS